MVKARKIRGQSNEEKNLKNIREKLEKACASVHAARGYNSQGLPVAFIANPDGTLRITHREVYDPNVPGDHIAVKEIPRRRVDASSEDISDVLTELSPEEAREPSSSDFVDCELDEVYSGDY